MTDKGIALAERLTKTEREQRWANQKPVDAATLILIDRSGKKPKVLMASAATT